MSSRTAILALLAGISAVAAGYFLVFRRKDKKEEDKEDEYVDLLPPESEGSKDKFNDYNDEIGEEDSFNEDTSIISSITEHEDLTLEEGLEDNLGSGNDASEEVSSSGRRKNESLMEWIDRQLKEAEARGRSSSKLTTEERKLFSSEVVKEEIKTEEGFESIKRESSSAEETVTAIRGETTLEEQKESMESMVIIDQISDEVHVSDFTMEQKSYKSTESKEATTVDSSEKRNIVFETHVNSIKKENNEQQTMESREIRTNNGTADDNVEGEMKEQEVSCSKMRDRDCDTGESMVFIDRIPHVIDQTVDPIKDINVLPGASDEYIELLKEASNGSDRKFLEDSSESEHDSDNTSDDTEEASVNVPTLINLYETRLKDE